MSKDALIDKLIDLVGPIVTELNYELYHLEFVREGNENYFRIYIDKENGGISLEDCEKVSRAVSDMLDVEDPISEGYYLEVSSPGIERILYTDKHLERYIGSNILVKLSGILNGKKKFEGQLLGFSSEELRIKSEEEEISIPRHKVSRVSLKGEL
ncbi:ribosome maturation factor RimP [Clostridium sp. CX1]|uniref:Ribosome maturation factor RimP n=1 Tax=Clostridium tanneri TaxID=3037988 RepID=A0ABU4JSA3_9CLOT|nr:MULTISPECIES: ribosome maturation factor RimP [unclassified Clostridium]MCT8976820.1 ribosome maturation factor RimP [Clostridium sp. CX1]MDW8801025.1 ribosome maturation factor RimP [Clostridium sp. A1-XYC3]